MVIHVHVVCWNEADLIPWIIAHYSQFADQIYFHDNFSDDGSRDLIKQCPIASLIDYDTAGEIRDDLLIGLKNNCWKRRGADWVVCVDADEFVYVPGPDPRSTLQYYEQESCAVPITQWIEMVGDGVPSFRPGIQLYEIIDTGVREGQSKSAIFRAAVTEEINYGPGAHYCDPNLALNWHGPININPQVLLLHFKHARPLDAVLSRHMKFAKRLSDTNRTQNWGHHYELPELAIDARCRLLANAQRIYLRKQLGKV